MKFPSRSRTALLEGAMKIGEAVSTGASRLSTELSNAVTEAAATVQNIVDQSETLVNELKALPQDI
ncbi:MAG: hypothetical protein HN645_03110, partial [Gemmatimonadales bacterium]|nr:hypothetical protein [Gemmatimonadales bacterium]